MIRKILIIFTAINVLTEASVKFSISKEALVGTEVGKFDFAAKILTRTSYFKFYQSSGRLVTSRILDDFADDRLLFLAEGKKPNFTIVEINVINSKNHDFSRILSGLRRLQIYENVPIGTKFSLNIADIRRKTSTFELLGDFSSDFSLDSELFLVTNTLLDRETRSKYDLVVKSRKNDTLNIRIEILDINDNYPRFVDQIFEKTIHFNDHLPKFTAVDSDIGENSLISYSILKNSTDQIDIDSYTGQIFLDSVNNVCFNCSCVSDKCKKIVNFRIFASDHGNPKLTSSIDCVIKFIDYPIINHKLPKISFKVAKPKRLVNNAYYQHKFYASLEENPPVGSFVVAVANFSTNFQHRIINGNRLDWFQIGEKSGIITTKKEIDYEIAKEIQLKVQLFDKSRALSSCTVYIKILDVDDNAPIFEKLVHNFTVMENLASGSKMFTFKAFDVDSTPIIYSFSPKLNNISEDGYFFINSNTGNLYTVKSFDFADISRFSFDIFATSQKLFASCQVKVYLIDTNNHRPKFSPREYFVNVKPTTKKIVRLEAYDLDTGDNGRIEYFILGDSSTNFHIDPYSGILYSTKKLQNFTKLIISARDWGNLQASNNATVNIFVLDDPDNQSPKFMRPNFVFNVKETDLISPNYVVGSVSAIDRVEKSIIEYKILGDHENFMIGRYSGEIRVRSPLNCDLCGDINFLVAGMINRKGASSANISIKIHHESKRVDIFKKRQDEVQVDADFTMGIPFYYLKVKDQLTTFNIASHNREVAIDSKNGGLFFTGPISSSNVTIFANFNNYTDSMVLVIRGISKEDYKIHVDSDYYFDVPESTAMNTVLTKLDHRGAIFESESTQDSDLFGMLADGTIFVKNQLDFEKLSHFTLPFIVSFDQSKHFSTAHFNILDVNDNEPVCDDRTSVFDIFEEIPPNSHVGYFRATDLDSIVSYHIPKEMQSYFAIDSTTGRIATKFKFDYEILDQKTFETYVIIRDENFTVNCPLKIRILNSNDNRPMFVRNHNFVEIYENIDLNSSVLTLQVSDEDQDQLKFELDDQNFAIDRFSGEIFTNVHFDREFTGKYEIVAKVSDGRYVSDATISVRILDFNDNFPEFDTSAASFLNISRFSSVGTHLHTFRATDSDIGLNSFIQYTILSGNELDTFFLDPLNGNLTLVKKLKFQNYSLIIRAEDHGFPRLFKDVNFEINVLDRNPSSPMIDFNSTLFNIDQSSRPGVQVAQISSVGSFYKILYQAPSFNAFSILDGKAGRIYLNENLKFDFYNILLEVEHIGSKTTQLISFFVTRNQTKFEKSHFSIKNIAILNSRAVQSGQRIESFNKTNLNIIGDDESGKLFEISTHGDLYIKRSSLIYKPIYRLTISNNRDSTFSFTVLLTNSKFSNVRFEKDSYEFTFDIGNATEIGQVRASQDTDNQNLHFSKFEYFLTDVMSTNDNLPMNYFSIDNTGKIRTTSHFRNDLEDIDQAMLKIFAIDVLATEPQTAECLVNIRFVKSVDSIIKFAQLFYDFSIAENSPSGSIIGRLEPESSSFKKPLTTIKFYIAEQSENFLPFILNPENGVLALERLIDREQKSEYTFSAMITDGRSVSYAIVYVKVEDVNDNAPHFDPKYYSFKVRENVPEATFIGKISAYDVDDAITSQNGQISYFLDEEAECPFKIDSQTGIVTTKSLLDTEKMPFYKLKVWAIDLGKPPMKTAVNVYFDILDENDNFPILSQKAIDLIIPEDLTVGSTVTKLESTDADPSSEFHFEIWSGNVNDTFSIDQNTGNLKIARPLDRETLSNYSMLVKVYDTPPTKSIRHFDICRIKIDLSDINDNAPVFVGPMLVNVPGNTPIMSKIFQLEAFDPDFGDNSLYEFSMTPDHRAPFVVDHVTGNVLVTSSLKEKSYTFTVIVFDKMKPELKSYANFTVEIYNRNDLAPKFSGERSYSLRISDNLTVDSIIKRFRVEGGDKMYFWLRNSKFFDVDLYLGSLYLIRPLDLSNFHNFSIFVGNEFENSTDRIDLLLEIVDTNNHAPIFKQDPYIFSIGENFPIFPAKIGQVEAIDQDQGLNSKLSYAITRGNLSQFNIDPLTGEIKVIGPLDREFTEKYSLTVEASDAGNEKLTGTTIVIVIVLDLNDNSPKFDQPYYIGRVTENVPIGTKVLCILATDADSGTNGEIEYVLPKSADEVPFKVDSITGILYTSSNIDREFKNQYHFAVRAYDNGQGHKLYSDSNVTVIVLDVNDNPPIIKADKQDIALKYPSKLDDLVHVVDASDSDLNENGSLNFSILGQDTHFFAIDNGTGAIKSKILDLRSDSYALDVNVQDGGGQQASASFRFFFRPAEDCPEFTEPKDGTVFTLVENSTPTEIALFKALSRKPEPFSRISYSISPSSLFHIDADSGILTSGEDLDFDTPTFSTNQQLHNLWISASDNDSPSCTVYRNIKIKLLDVNDNAPFFEQAVFEVHIQEERPAPVNILKVTGRDLDSGDNARLSYTIINHQVRDFFQIDWETGQISTLKTLDYETLNKFEFIIQVEDQGAPMKLSSTALVKVFVDDINDNAPKFTHIFTASVAENSNLGTFVARITSIDADGPKNSNNTYSIINGKNHAPFKIDPSNGTVWTSGHLDREIETNYALKIAASDGTWHVETTLSIVILDQNDNDPVFDQSIYIFNISSDQEEFSVGRVFARDADEPGSPNSKISYRLITKSVFFDVDPHDGALYVRKMLRFDSINFASNFRQFYVSAYDSGRPTRFSSTLVVLRVVEANVYAPIFNEGHYIVAMPAVVHSNLDLVTVRATDLDHNANVYYKEHGVWRGFTINSITGTIHSTESIQSHSDKVYQLSALAYDNGNPPKFSTCNVTLIVLPDNVTIPKFRLNSYAISVPENVPINTTLLSLDVISNINPILFVFEIDPLSYGKNFRLDRSGNLSLIKNLDYEFETEYYFNISIKIRGFSSEKSRTVVNITVIDIDDNKPIFKKSENCQIHENCAIGQKVCRIEARDLDTLENNKLINYRLIGDPAFIIDSNGSICANEKINFERNQSFEYTVVAFNPKNIDMASEIKIKIDVLDVNEFLPKFTKNYSKMFVPKNDRKVKVDLEAMDNDVGRYGKIFYFVRNSNFSIDADRNLIINENYSVRPQMTLVIGAMNYPITSDYEIDYAILDIEIFESSDDFAFRNETFYFSIAENVDNGTLVGRVLFENQFEPYLTLSKGFLPFRIDRKGDIFTNSNLDRETKDFYEFEVSAEHESYGIELVRCTVEVHILDVNDNAPYLHQNEFHILENEPPHMNITQLKPFDVDSDQFEFQLLNSTDSKFFYLHQKSGLLSCKISFDREKRRKYDLNVNITDNGRPKLSKTSQISICIDDQNDNPPKSTNLHILVNIRHASSQKLEKLASIEPDDPDDTAGHYACHWEPIYENKYRLEQNCDLYSNRIENSVFTVRSSDGIHETVTYNVTVTTSNISDDMINSCRFFMVTESKFYESLNMLMTNGQILSINRTSRDTVELCYHGLNSNILKIKPSLCKFRNFCQNGGKCVDLNLMDTKSREHVRLNNSHILSFNPISQSYQCLCNSEFSGQNCEMPKSYCTKIQDQCKNGGKCVDNACQCSKNFTGKFCEIDLDECQNASNPCQNGAYCENTSGSFKCHCLLGFQGPLCVQPSKNCTSHTCLNGATCIDRGSDFVCQCLFGYFGKFCETSSLGFNESSYMMTKIRSNSDGFKIEYEFSTLINEGILMSARNGEDFLVVYITNGRLNTKIVKKNIILSNMELEKRINDAKFYKFRMIIDKMNNLSVELSPCFGERCQKSSQISDYLKSVFSRRVIYFGKHNLTFNGQNSFIGCLKNLTFNGKNVEVMEKSAVSDYCPRKKESLCGTDVCGGGKCNDHWTNITCTCEDGILASNCSKIFDSSFLKDGYLQYDFRPILTIDQNGQNWISIDFTTTTSDGRILSADRENKTHIVVELLRGKLRFIIDSKQFWINNSRSFNDGLWHRLAIDILSTNGKITLKVDDYEKEIIHALKYFRNSNSVNFYLGGNGDNSIRSFSGCIRRFIFDGILMPVKPTSENLFAKVTTIGRTTVDDCSSLQCISTTVTGSNSCLSDRPNSFSILAASLSTILVLAILVSMAIWTIVRYKRRYTKPKLNTVIVSHLPTRIDKKDRFASLKMTNISSSIESCTNRDSGIGGVLAESVEILNRPRSNSNSSRDIHNSSSILHSKAENSRNQRVYLADNYGTIDLERNSNNLIAENSSNGLDVERYDLDNASSIASSDTDIVRHYNILRTSSRQNLPKNGVKLAITPSTLADSNSKNSLARKNRRRHNHVADLGRGSYNSINRKIVDNSTSDENRRPIYSSAKRRRKSSRRRKSQSPAITVVSSLSNATIFRRRSSSSSGDLADQYSNCYRKQNGEIWVKKPSNRDNIRSDYGEMSNFDKNDQPPNYCPHVSVRQQFFVDDTETESEYKINNNGVTLPGCRSRESEISEDERIFTHNELSSRRANMEAYV